MKATKIGLFVIKPNKSGKSAFCQVTVNGARLGVKGNVLLENTKAGDRLELGENLTVVVEPQAGQNGEDIPWLVVK
jgi:hypothetical protein